MVACMSGAAVCKAEKSDIWAGADEIGTAWREERLQGWACRLIRSSLIFEQVPRGYSILGLS